VVFPTAEILAEGKGFTVTGMAELVAEPQMFVVVIVMFPLCEGK
jgi:hypothetical protein